MQVNDKVKIKDYIVFKRNYKNTFQECINRIGDLFFLDSYLIEQKFGFTTYGLSLGDNLLWDESELIKVD